MAERADGYNDYYAGKLWSLLPSIYRSLDGSTAFDPDDPSPATGPLREIVNRIGVQAAVLRRSLDRLWDDQSIETCDDWVIPYIGAQLSSLLVASLDARGRRIEVAKTIYDRQRKGTLPILEEVTARVTGWDARVIEGFRRLSRSRHGLDPIAAVSIAATGLAPPTSARRAPAKASGLVGRTTGTPAGGVADLRDAYGASRAGTAFDEFAHAADLRDGQAGGAPYNLAQLGVFLWRLQSVTLLGVTPVASKTGRKRYTFDPTGRDIPLFAAPVELTFDTWVPRAETQMPGPIDTPLLRQAMSELYAQGGDRLAPASIGLYTGAPSASTLIEVDQVSAGPRASEQYEIDPEHGRFTAPSGQRAATGLQVGYCQGVASTIGAGGFDRRIPGVSPAQGPAATQVIQGGGALPAVNAGVVEIADSLTYDGAPDVSAETDLSLRAANMQRPLVRFEVPAKGRAGWTFTGGAQTLALKLDGLFLSGADLVLAGSFEKVELTNCTLDPGSYEGDRPLRAIDGQTLVASRLVIAGQVRELVIERCITGPITLAKGGSVETVRLADSIVQAQAAEEALSLTMGETMLWGCTVIGRARLHQIEASNCIFSDVVKVANTQWGCLRYSAWRRGGDLPSQYACVDMAPDQALFASVVFGDPNYARLAAGVDPAIGEGGEGGVEMGAFARDRNPIKVRSLLIKFGELGPTGLAPMLIYVT
jgi:hypothetical protein